MLDLGLPARPGWQRTLLFCRAREDQDYLAAHGKTNTQIAAELWVTPGTVKKHLENVYAKLGVTGRAAAARIPSTV